MKPANGPRLAPLAQWWDPGLAFNPTPIRTVRLSLLALQLSTVDCHPRPLVKLSSQPHENLHPPIRLLHPRRPKTNPPPRTPTHRQPSPDPRPRHQPQLPRQPRRQRRLLQRPHEIRPRPSLRRRRRSHLHWLACKTLQTRRQSRRHLLPNLARTAPCNIPAPPWAAPPTACSPNSSPSTKTA